MIRFTLKFEDLEFEPFKYGMYSVATKRYDLFESTIIQLSVNVRAFINLTIGWLRKHPVHVVSLFILTLFPLPQAHAIPSHDKPAYWKKIIKPEKKIKLTRFTSFKKLKLIPEVYRGTGDYYLDWIIDHESGGDSYARNPSGACGLGQSLPCSKVLSKCGSLSRVSCQIQWVREYCIASYGSTYRAYLAWNSQYDSHGNHWY